MKSLNSVSEKYIARLRDRCLLDTFQSDLYQSFSYSQNILYFLINSDKPQNLKHITFSRLKDIACKENDFLPAKFKLTLAILTDERVNILIEVFEAHDLDTDESIILTFDEISDFMINNRYINPFTEEEISEVDFSKMITTFFSISDELLEDLNVQ